LLNLFIDNGASHRFYIAKNVTFHSLWSCFMRLTCAICTWPRQHLIQATITQWMRAKDGFLARETGQSEFKSHWKQMLPYRVNLNKGIHHVITQSLWAPCRRNFFQIYFDHNSANTCPFCITKGSFKLHN
jgi:hypothetical protein